MSFRFGRTIRSGGSLFFASVLASAAGMCGFAKAGQTVLLDFYGDYCPPCREMAPILDSLAAAGQPVQKINVAQRPDMARQYGVTGVPCFVMLVDGVETDRVVGRTSRSRLEQMLAAADVVADPPTTVTTAPPGFPKSQPQDPFATADSRWQGGHFATGAVPQPPAQAAAAEPPRHVPTRETPGLPARPTSGPADPLGAYHAAVKRAQVAAVRLKVTDADGASFGSGTIIDSHEGEALVLTCAHIFRESDGKGHINVDLFTEGAPHSVTGKLLRMNLEHDVALVIIRPQSSVPVMQVAGVGAAPARGARVFAVGCDRGMRPSVQETRVTMIDRFLGPANIEVAGQPVDGRSGGGLFNEDGKLVGVCNGQNPQDNEGVFAALSVVQQALDEARLGFVFRDQNDSENAFAGGSSVPPSHVAPASANLPLPATEGAAGEPSLVLTAEEQRLVETLRRADRTSGAVCVLPPAGGPHAGRLIVIDHPSPRMLDDLTRASRTADRGRTAAVEPSFGGFQR
jgi:thiol-disulfide isomerase/thioredoxin